MTEYLYGFHVVETVLAEAPQRVRQLLLNAQRGDARLTGLDAMAQAVGIDVRRVAMTELGRLVGDVSHQGVVAEIEPAPELDEEDLYDRVASMLGVDAGGMPRSDAKSLAARGSEAPLLLVLDEVTDPRNFGALLRVADGAGVHAVVTTKRNSPPLTAVVHKSSAGAALMVPIYRVTNLARALGRLQELGVWLVGLDDAAAQLWHEADLCLATALVLGAEGAGLRRLTREHCDLLVKLPMAGIASSLNVSVAAGIALYEARRQRGASSG